MGIFSVVPYEVTVYTGDKRGAGTNANVFINMFGTRGDTGDRPLKKSKSNFDKFEKKSVSVSVHGTKKQQKIIVVWSFFTKKVLIGS